MKEDLEVDLELGYFRYAVALKGDGLTGCGKRLCFERARL
jgi:hypothetical protein